jgi:hypothetical protein
MADDLNLMQAQLGLPNYGNSANPLGVQTIAPPLPPQVMHPGEFSQNIVQQAQQQSMQVVQQTQMTRPGAMGGYGTPGTGGGYGSFPTAGPMGPMGNFGQQFQANMGSINQGQFGNPYYAQALSGMMGMQGFNQGMMPSPTMMTPPNMGIFRPFPQGPTPSIPPVPQMPLVQHPFTPQMPAPRFQTPMEYDYNVGNQRGQQYQSAFLSTPGVAARGASAVGGAYLGGALGAAAGGFLGGARGVGIGSAVGSVAGMAMSEMGGFGQAAEHIADRMNPFRSMGIRGAQMKGISQGFVVGGSSLHESGRGMSTRGSQHLGRLIEDLAYDPQFRKEQGGPSQFSAQDMSRITKMSGDQGMLDMAQNPEQIRDQVKNVAKGLRSFMRIAGEPDVHEAIKQMGQLRAMGLSMPQIDTTMQNVRMYAKMAGTTVKSLMEGAGLQGAMVFQQQGMSAGLGVQMGAAAMGHARQAVAGGTYSPAQLALLGGTQGVAQRDMETSAAMLKMPVMLAAMSQMGKGGTFGLDASSMRNVMSGKTDINQIATGGANNLLSAVNKGGIGALATFQIQQNELADQVGKALGPEGVNMMKMNQVIQTQKMLGIKGPGGFATAAKAMGMDDQATRQLMLQANSPGYFKNVSQQYNRQIGEARAQEAEERRTGGPGIVSALEQDETIGGAARTISGKFRGEYRSWRNTLEATNSFFAERGDDAARRKEGRYSFRSPEEMRATEREQRLMGGVSSEAKSRFAGEVESERSRLSDTSALFSVGGRGYGRSSGTKTFQDLMGGDADTLAQVRKGEGGWAGRFGGGTLERVGRLTGFGSPLAAPLMWGNAAYSDDLRKRGADIDAGSKMMFKGLTASATDITKSEGSLEKTLGVSNDKAASIQAAVAQKLANTAKGEAPTWASRLFGVKGGSMTKSQISAAIEAAGKEQGLTSDQIQKMQDNAGDVVTGAAKLGETLSGTVGRDAFAMQEVVDTKGHQDTVDAVRRVQLKKSDELFGDKGTLGSLANWGGGVDSRREEAKNVLFGMYKDHRVSAYASLMRAASHGDKDAQKKLNEYHAQLPSAERSAIQSQAQDLLKSAEDKGLGDLLSDAGSQLANKDIKDIDKTMRGQRESHLASKGFTDRDKGMENLFGKDALDKGGDLKGTLDKLSADKGARSKLQGRGRELADKWAATTDAGARAELLGQIEGYAAQAGSAEGEVRGGSKSRKERGLQEAKEGMADLQTVLAESFPDAVDTFQEASVMMLEAAKHFGNARPDTSLNEEQN